MVENKLPQPETAEQLGQQLLEFVDKAEFGTAEFHAITDYLALRSLSSLREDDIDKLAEDTLTRSKRESDIRIYELKIALLEHQIEQNKSQLPGYSQSYLLMEKRLDDIYSLAMVEAGNKFTDLADQETYARELHSVVYEGAYEIISMKRDSS